MAVPKKKQSRSRTLKRRSSKKIKDIHLSVCPHCHSAKLPHHICMNCGYYGDKQIIVMESE